MIWTPGLFFCFLPFFMHHYQSSLFVFDSLPFLVSLMEDIMGEIPIIIHRSIGSSEYNVDVVNRGW